MLTKKTLTTLYYIIPDKPFAFIRNFFLGTLLIILFFSCKSLPEPYSRIVATDGSSIDLSRQAIIWEQFDSLFFKATQEKINGNKTLAQSLYQKCVALHPQQSAPYYELSKLWSAEQKWELAKDNIVQALQIKPQEKWYLMQWVNILRYEKRYREAIQVLDQVIVQTRNPSLLMRMQINIWMRAQQFDSAYHRLPQWLKVEGEDELLSLQTKAQIEQELKLTTDAKRTLQTIVTLYPNEASARWQLLDICLAEKDTAAFFEMFSQSIQSFSNNINNINILVQRYNVLEDSKILSSLKTYILSNKNIPLEYKTALLLPIWNRNSDTLISILLNEEDTMQNSKANYYFLIATLYKLERKADATIAYLEKAIATQGATADMWKMLLLEYRVSHRYEEIISLKTLLLQQNFQESWVYEYLAAAYEKESMLDSAITYYRWGLSCATDSTDLYRSSILLGLAGVLHVQEQHRTSDSLLNQLLKETPENAIALNNYSYFLSLREQHLDSAENMCWKALHLMPHQPEFLHTFGFIQYKKGKYQEAIKYYEKAETWSKDADGELATLWNDWGDAALKLGHNTEAIKMWKKAANTSKDAVIINNKIKLYQEHEQ
jgi:tetratricopeptide (TPR) repeat protein